MTRVALASAIDEAAARDPVLANLVSQAGVIKYRPRSADGPFGAWPVRSCFSSLPVEQPRPSSAVWSTLWAVISPLRR